MFEGSECSSVFERKTRNRNRGGRTKGKKQKQRSSLSILSDTHDDDGDHHHLNSDCGDLGVDPEIQKRNSSKGSKKKKMDWEWSSCVFRNVMMTRHAYMKWDEIKISNHPILDSSDVFCVQGD